MDKSEFYKQWYTRQEGTELNEYGFPPIDFKGNPITTDEQWNEFIQIQIDPEDFAKISNDAADLIESQFVAPHVFLRNYPDPSEQLDGIYKALLAIKESGIDIGTAGTAYLDSITAVKASVPKTHTVPAAPDPTGGIETEDLPLESLPEFPPDYEPPV